MPRSKPSATPRSPRNRAGSTTSWRTPKPTDVIAYAYLWHREAAEGREEGVKDRPVVVVVALEERPHGTQLLVVPVTTRAPRQGDATLEIPVRVRQHLGLDDQPCWIVADEYNLFTWPGPDIRPIKRAGEVDPFYGSIPGRLFDQLRLLIDRVARAGKMRETKRTE